MAAGGASAAGRADAAHRRDDAACRQRSAGHASDAAFLEGLRDLGWIVGRNVEFDYRWAAGVAGAFAKYAAELVALAPDVIAVPRQRVLGTIAAGCTRTCQSFSLRPRSGRRRICGQPCKPGGNATGFMTSNRALGAKWLELLKELVPGMKRTAVLRDPDHHGRDWQCGAIPGRVTVARRGVEPDRRSQCSRNRACRRGIRACPERRPDLSRQRTSGNYIANVIIALGGPAQTAHDLLRTLLRQLWRPDLLWA